MFPRSNEDPVFSIDGTIEDVKLEISVCWDVPMEDLKTTVYTVVAQSRLRNGCVVWEVFERKPRIFRTNARGELLESTQQEERTVRYVYSR